MALDAVTEASSPYSHAHHSSLSRAIGAVTGSFTRQKTRRRLSSFSSATSGPRRRGSIQTFIDSLPSSTVARKQNTEQQRMPLQHQDSAMPSLPTQQNSSRQAFSSLKRLSTIRRRNNTSSHPGDASKPAYFAPTFTCAPQQAPGAAARQAAAAANQDRQNQLRREQEDTQRFLNGLIPAAIRDDDIKDNESGVGMICASPIVYSENLADKKKSMLIFLCLPHHMLTQPS